MRLLAGDVGGTKTLLRCVEADGTVVRTERYDSGTWPAFDDLLREFLAQGIGPIESACFAVAGPVLGGRAEVTNVGWLIEEAALARAFSIARVSLINDFYAIGLGVPLLGPDDLLSIQQGERDRTAPMAILGAGTGLGEALVVNIGGAYHVIPGEGGHADFSPQDEEQARLFLHLQKQYGGHVSSERVISGMGLVNIFTFLGGEEIEAAEISERADAGDPTAARAFAMFVDAYGAEAGDVALRTLARGGVYLAGGIAAKNTRWFTDGAFVDAFTRKGRFSDVMRTMPVDLILNEQVGLIGAVDRARRIALESPSPAHG
jgi:glucokinase